jgi:HAD superfamily hydrolase (TIGR01484 family)
MTEKIGFVASDIDGTQLKPFESRPSPAVRAAAHALRHNRIYLSEVSSRPPAMIASLVGPLALGNNLCSLSGGAILSRASSGEIVWSRLLSGETKRTVILGVGGLCTKINFDMVTRKQEPAQVMASVESDSAPSEEPAIFMVVSARKSDAVLESVANIPGIQHTGLMSNDQDRSTYTIQVMAPGVDKQSGVERVRQYAGLDECGVIIGDGRNDLPMFAAARPGDIRVAINNVDTPEELKDAADWVAPSVQDDGFAIAMERCQLI